MEKMGLPDNMGSLDSTEQTAKTGKVALLVLLVPQERPEVTALGVKQEQVQLNFFIGQFSNF
jgi:hypothetical protein